MSTVYREPDAIFAAFYTRHYTMVYRLCLMYMKNRFEAEDCTEDTFVKVLTARPVFTSEEHEKAWLLVTAMNVCKNSLKRAWRRKQIPMEQAENVPCQPSRAQEVRDAVQRLPERCRDAVYLYYYMGYSTEAIAAMLKKPASTIRNRLRDARLLLRAQWGDDWDEE